MNEYKISDDYARKHREWGAFVKGIVSDGDLIRAGRELAAMATEALNGPGSASEGFRADTVEALASFHAACMAQERAQNAVKVAQQGIGVFIAVLPLISMFEDARRLSPYIIRHEASKSAIYGNAEMSCDLQIFNGTAAGETVVLTEIGIKRRRPSYAHFSYENNHNAPTILQAIDAAEDAAREWWARMSKEWN